MEKSAKMCSGYTEEDDKKKKINDILLKLFNFDPNIIVIF